MQRRVAVLGDDANEFVVRSLAAHLAAAGVDLTTVDPPSSSSELAGIEAAFVALAPPHVPAAVDAVVAAGTTRVVLLSSASAPYERGVPVAQQWFLPAEHAVESSGLQWTVVRPVGLMAAALGWATDVRSERTVRHPYALAAYPHVHEADIAAVAAVALLDDGHHGRRYTVSGPESITPVEQSAALAIALGHPLGFEELDPHQAADRWRADGWTQESIELELMLLADFVDRAPRPRDTVPRLLGRPALPFTQWAVDHVDDFR